MEPCDRHAQMNEFTVDLNDSKHKNKEHSFCGPFELILNSERISLWLKYHLEFIMNVVMRSVKNEMKIYWRSLRSHYSVMCQTKGNTTNKNSISVKKNYFHVFSFISVQCYSCNRINTSHWNKFKKGTTLFRISNV